MLACVWGGACASLSADEVIRIMAANTTSGNNSSYTPGEGNRIFQGLDPDIALVQEMNYLSNSPAEMDAWVETNFGPGFYYFRQTEPGIQIPNGIVSRYPILASGAWDDTTMANRDYSWARIDIPGDKDLWAVSVHLSSGGGASQRDLEAAEIKDYILNGYAGDPPYKPATLPIPASDYLVIGGDFNTTSRTEKCIITLSAVVVTLGPYPADQAGDTDTNNGSSRNNPYDWVIPDADLNALKTPLVIGSNTFPNGLVFDSRVYTPLSEVPPVRVTDSDRFYPSGVATNMQHMAVMRAFLIPTNDPPVIVSAANSSSTETVTDPDSSVYEIVRGTSVGLSVVASDDAGEAALKTTWSKTGGSGGTVTFSANGTNAAKNCTATFATTGNYTLTATVRDAPGLTVTSSVRVRVVQSAASLALQPPAATLAVNATQSFTATLLDQFNQAMAATIVWSASGGGTIAPSGVFTATSAGGPYGVTASSGGFSKTSDVTVTRAAATVTLSGLNPAYDGYPKPVAVTTTPTGLSVTTLYGGSPAPPVSAGSYAVTATITDSNYQGASSATLIIAPDEWALWKNTYFTMPELSLGLAADSADPDSDGLTNLAEYALGAHPRQFTAPLRGVMEAGGFSLTFTRPANLPGIRYFAEATGNFSNWSPVTLELVTPGAVETVRAFDPFGPNPSVPRFLRLRFERE